MTVLGYFLNHGSSSLRSPQPLMARPSSTAVSVMQMSPTMIARIKRVRFDMAGEYP